jgi:hypothetical protein
MAAWGKEFLGWNLRWVLGYRGTSELFVALDRGEIDMTATSNMGLFSRLLAGGKSKILVQSGTTRAGRLSPRAEFSDASLMPLLLQDRIKDPIAVKSFEYWLTVHSGPDKWLALPPNTPGAVADVYRYAFSRLSEDPDFIDRSKKVADDFTPIVYPDVEFWMKALGNAPPDAIEFIAAMMRGQGVKID